MPENTQASRDFTAVLLAGGRSTRMGQDKAGLTVEGEPLWQRQLGTLRATGANELLISGRPDGPFAMAGVSIIEDAEPGLGPLGGIVSALERARYDLVLVLAVDLPRMNAGFLRELVAVAPVVPHRDSRFEPLAAVYTREFLGRFREQLSRRELSLQRTLHQMANERLIAVREITPVEAPLFDNLNTPEDLAYFRHS